MTATTFYNGHKIYWNDKKREWYYEDGQIIKEYRKCPKCNQLPTGEGHDACIANLPGVLNACCGHGVEDGYIQFTDNTVIRFKFLASLLKVNPRFNWNCRACNYFYYVKLFHSI